MNALGNFRPTIGDEYDDDDYEEEAFRNCTCGKIYLFIFVMSGENLIFR